MWILFAFGSAFFAGITAILAKCGIRKTDSTVATAVRTIVVLLFSWLMVFVVGPQDQLGSIDPNTWLFLILSGLATGASWLCYFRALQLQKEDQKKSWFLYAAGSAIFASLTSILGKIGISGVESNLGTAIRTAVVLLMAWVMVFVAGKAGEVRKIPKNEFGFICLSGIATGASWLCYYRALQDGLASIVVPIDKLSILVTVAFSYFVFHERLSKKSAIGLVLIVAGTLAMLI